MDTTIFSQSVTRVRYMENSLIPRDKLETMADEKDFDRCIKMLQDTYYAKYIDTFSYDEGLKIALQDMYKLMKEIVPLKYVVEIPALRYDLHNIKCLIKGKLSGVDVDRLLIDAGVISIVDLRNTVNDQDNKSIHSNIKSTIDRAMGQFMENNNPQDIDIVVDKGLYEYMADSAKETKIRFMEEFARLLIDSKNIKMFLRVYSKPDNRVLFSKLYIEGGSFSRKFFEEYQNESLEKFLNKMNFTNYYKWSEKITNGNIESAEKIGDNFILDCMKKAKLISFGPEPIVAYILARETEIKNIRIVLTGKLNGVKSDAIRERLRDTYV